MIYVSQTKVVDLQTETLSFLSKVSKYKIRIPEHYFHFYFSTKVELDNAKNINAVHIAFYLMTDGGTHTKKAGFEC